MKNGWKWRKLGEICSVDKCQGAYKHLPYVGLEHIESNTGRFIGSTEPVTVKSSTFKFSPAHLLYGRLRPYLNKVMAPDFEGHCSTEIFPIRPHGGLSREFLLYWFLQAETASEINSTCRGARMPRANMNAVLDFTFPLPPLPDQRRIVAILDEAFTAIDTTKANTEKNFQNARTLFESHLQDVFAQCGMKWRMVRLGEVTELARGHNPPKSKFSREPKPGYVRFYQIRDGSTDNHAVYVPDSPQLHKMTKDDIMMVAYRHVGRAFRGVEGAFNVALCKVSNSRRDLLDDDFLYQLISSRFVKGELLKRSERSLIPSMSIDHLRDLKIPLPPLHEQQRVTAGLNRLSNETQQLAAIYQQKLAALEDLKKSLLHQAFTGQL